MLHSPPASSIEPGTARVNKAVLKNGPEGGGDKQRSSRLSPRRERDTGITEATGVIGHVTHLTDEARTQVCLCNSPCDSHEVGSAHPRAIGGDRAC